MLEFIVLGQIPGTHIIITFQWAVILAVLLTCAVVMRRVKKHNLDHTAVSQHIAEITL